MGDERASLSMWLVEDGETHFVIAADEADARAIWREEMNRMGISDDDLDEPTHARALSRDEAARLNFWDGDASNVVSSMLAECERDPSRRYVGGSEY